LIAEGDAMNCGKSMLTIWTYDWVPDGPRGLVRDLRLRWACEEAALDYQVKSTPFDNRGPDHFARQPFGQVPFLEDNGITIFESGACLLHLARKSETLMPRDPIGEADTLQWTIAALNSVEIVSVPWAFLSWSGEPDNGLAGWLGARLGHVEAVVRGREWIAAGRFTVADITMADVLRQTLRADLPGYPNIRAYIERACARPAFKKAYADQIAHFAAGDRTRPN
jgi:glutathione S-transferase